MSKQEVGVAGRRQSGWGTGGRPVAWVMAALLCACEASGDGGLDGTPPRSGGGSALSVTPLGGFLSTGQQGGTFSPGSAVYSIRNGAPFPIDWSASSNQPWATLSQASGNLPVAGSVDLTVSIDPGLAAALGVGAHNAQVTISDDTLLETFVRTVTVQVIQGSGSDLSVTPEDDFASQGNEGGPFTPGFQDYTLRNDGTGTIDWSVTADQSWLELREGAQATTGGQLGAGAATVLTVRIDQAVAGALPPDTHFGQVLIVDETASFVFDRAVTLQVDPLGVQNDLTVTPASGFTSSGDQGGPFAPTNTTYTLQNTGASPLSWTASVDEPAFVLSTTTGVLSPGAQALVLLSVNQGVAASYTLGTHSGLLTFRNVTAGAAETRSVSLVVNPGGGGGGTTASSVSQFGITWEFDRSYPVGQFANGDWWVVGPVTIRRITPQSIETGGWIQHGSMINPTPRNNQTQGYDSTMYAQYKIPSYFSNELNVAFGVSPQSPVVVPPHSSLVSSISEAEQNLRPQLKTAAILTVLPSAAPPGSFRPPYSGADKSIEFNESDLDYSLLQRLPTPPDAQEVTTLAEAERMFERPWIDHVPLWINNYLHPRLNMPDYGREICDNVSVGALVLHMDYPAAQKRDLLVRYVQLGIDNYGVVQDDGQYVWPPSAGHHSGRKWPILFAGLMLGDPEMSSIGFDKTIQFGEDGQTFYVAQTSPGVINYGYGGYTSGQIGMPEWGTSHSIRPELDDSTWFGDPYRLCCTTNTWWGEVLAAYIMGAKDLWNHDALFDYMDRFLVENETVYNVHNWRLSWRRWYLEFWKAYRPNYP